MEEMTAEGKQATALIIRSASEHDAAALADLCTQLGYPSDEEQLQNRLARINQDANRALFVAQPAGGDIVGFIDLDTRCLAVKDVSVEVCALVIDQAARGQGYGRILLKQAEEWALALGAKDISLRSNVIRKDAHAFYKSCGYETYKQSVVFQKILASKAENMP